MSIQTKLLEAFDGQKGHVVSGQALARHLGVSRTAVWKQIQALKNVGLPIESSGRQGYRFGAAFDNSLLHFHKPSWITPHHYVSTASTQTLAKAGASSGLPEGHLWLAETQNKGRGRFERVWESSYGGLWFSLLLRPKVAPSRIAPLTLIAGLCLRESVASVCGLEPKLKWPNDLMISTQGIWKKCAGILTEMYGQVEQTDWVVLGLGLNVNNTLSSAMAARGVSLFDATEKAWPRKDLLEAFLKNFRPAYLRFCKEGFDPFQQVYWKHYFAPGRTIVLRTGEGDISGKARGVDAGGGIMIESRRKIRIFSEGEIL